MAKITLGKLAQDSTINEVKNLIKRDLSPKVAFKLKGLVDYLNGELKKYQELRKEILEKHAIKDADGKVAPDASGNYQFAGEGIEGVNNAMNELHKVEVEVAPIHVDDLGNDPIKTESLLNLGEIIHG
jgi:hypothetical protein